jgi:membrane protein implicated in regulation of membrane protease activity
MTMQRRLALGILALLALAGAFLVWAGISNLVAGDNATSTSLEIGGLGLALFAGSSAAIVVIVRR